MKLNFEISKDCRILLDWLLSHDTLTLRDIQNHLYIMGFDFPSTLASSYAFFLSEYHAYKNNENFQRLLVCFQRMIISQFMEFYNFYPCFNSIGTFGYTSQSAVDFV